MYKKKLLKNIGCFRENYWARGNYDLLLRAVANIENYDSIFHVPQVLLHKQFERNAQASNLQDQDIVSLKDFFHYKNYKAKIEKNKNNTRHIKWEISHPEPTVSLIIATRDGLHHLKICIDSILEKTNYRNFEILVIDNQSSDPEVLQYFEEIKLHPQITVIPYNHPFNYSAINNLGVSQARGTIIGLINNDTEVINEEWLTEMVSNALRPEIGCVGAKLYYPDGTIQHAGVILGIGSVAGHSHRFENGVSDGYFDLLIVSQNISAVTGAVLIVRKDVYNQVGGLEEKRLSVAYNDVDFCIKVREAGYRNLWTPFAELIHHESKSRGLDNTPEKLARYNSEVNFMKLKWGKILKTDPFYNPNFTIENEDYSIRISK